MLQLRWKLDWVRSAYTTTRQYWRHRVHSRDSVHIMSLKKSLLYDALKIDLATYCFVIFFSISVGIFHGINKVYMMFFSGVRSITFPWSCNRMIWYLCVCVYAEICVWPLQLNLCTISFVLVNMQKKSTLALNTRSLCRSRMKKKTSYYILLKSFSFMTNLDLVCSSRNMSVRRGREM